MDLQLTIPLEIVEISVHSIGIQARGPLPDQSFFESLDIRTAELDFGRWIVGVHAIEFHSFQHFAFVECLLRVDAQGFKLALRLCHGPPQSARLEWCEHILLQYRSRAVIDKEAPVSGVDLVHLVISVSMLLDQLLICLWFLLWLLLFRSFKIVVPLLYIAEGVLLFTLRSYFIILDFGIW